MYENSWKNKIVFQKQLELNKKELLNYPEHWKIFIDIVGNLLKQKNKLNLLDIGCGCGFFYKLCKDNFGDNIEYFGIDYAPEAIEIAKTEWKTNNFLTKNFFDIDSKFVNQYDIIHMGALLDVLPNGDEALEFILSFNVPYLYLGRIDIIENISSVTTYTAYDEITTYKYKHNFKNFINLINKNSYLILNIKNNNILLEKK